MYTTVDIARARRGSTLVPGSTQGEAGQGEATASEAGLGFPAAEGVELELLGSLQGEAGQGAAAASEAGILVAAAEGLGMAARTSSGVAGAGHSVLCPSAEGRVGFSWRLADMSTGNVRSCLTGSLIDGSTAGGELQLKGLISRLIHLKGRGLRDPRHQ